MTPSPELIPIVRTARGRSVSGINMWLHKGQTSVVVVSIRINSPDEDGPWS